MQVRKVAVVGAGTMGASIAVAIATNGIPIVLKDVDDKAIKEGMVRINRLMHSRVKKGLAQSQADGAVALIKPITESSCLQDVDLVIEAVAESMEIKKEVFQELDRFTNPQTILASNTSSLSITQLGSFTQRPDKVVGMHFFNPAHLMKLVEIIAGLETSSDTVKGAIEFGQRLGKLAVRVEECPSFLVNRLLGRYMNEALWCLEEGIAAVDEIDTQACDYLMPIGPLALRDMNGADIGLSVARYNYREYGVRFEPATILQEMVSRNWLGQKSGCGFYLYDAETRKRTSVNPGLAELLADVRSNKEKMVLPKKNHGEQLSRVLSTDFSKREVSTKPEFKVERLFLPMINEAFLVLQEKVCAAEDLDPAMIAGIGMRKGPLQLASDIGFGTCLSELERHFELYGERFRPASLLKRYVWAGRNRVV